MNEYLHAEVKAVDSKGSWTAVANVPVLDRDGERILPGALTWRTSSVPVHAGHNFKVESLVGRAKPYYDARGTLMVDGTFGTSALAQATREAVLDGTLTDMSIVFVGATKTKAADGATEITSGELVACDFVTIASNPDARVLAARGVTGGMTVAEAKAFVQQALRDLVALEIKDAERVLATTTPVPPLAFRRGGGDLTSQVNAFLRSM